MARLAEELIRLESALKSPAAAVAGKRHLFVALLRPIFLSLCLTVCVGRREDGDDDGDEDQDDQDDEDEEDDDCVSFLLVESVSRRAGACCFVIENELAGPKGTTSSS